MLDQAMRLLEYEQAKLGQTRAVCAHEAFPGWGRAPPYNELARELGETAGTLRVQVFRLRQNYHKLLRIPIAQTVETPAEVDTSFGIFGRLL